MSIENNKDIKNKPSEDNIIMNQINDLKNIIESLSNLQYTIESLGSKKSNDMKMKLDETSKKLIFYREQLKLISIDS